MLTSDFESEVADSAFELFVCICKCFVLVLQNTRTLQQCELGNQGTCSGFIRLRFAYLEKRFRLPLLVFLFLGGTNIWRSGLVRGRASINLAHLNLFIITELNYRCKMNLPDSSKRKSTIFQKNIFHLVAIDLNFLVFLLQIPQAWITLDLIFVVYKRQST